MAKLVLEVQSDQAEKALRLLKGHLKDVGIEGQVVQKRFGGMESSSMRLGRAFAFVGTAVAAIGNNIEPLISSLTSVLLFDGFG